MKGIVLGWFPKDIPDLKRRHEGRAFQEKRTDQPKQRRGVQRVHGMFGG